MLGKKARLRLRPFVPRDLLPSKGERVERGAFVGEHTLLLADITGFAELSERLASKGGAGSEELAGILNSTFEPILAALEEYGAIVLSFCGDAVFALFAGTDAAARWRALSCAERIRNAVVERSSIKSSVGAGELSVTIGVHAGQVVDFRVGNEQRVLRVLGGETPKALYGCRRKTAPNTVCLMPLVAEGLEKRLELRKGRESLELVRMIEAAAPDKAKPLPEGVGQGIETLLPQGRVERLLAMPEDKIPSGEHRYATVMFVNFSGIPQRFAPYNEYVNKAWRIIHKFGGIVEKIDIGSDGDRLMAIFGLPTACEDDEKRAALAARELLAAAPAGAVQRIGISSGSLFSCVIGSARRRAFAVMGETVVLAARQMEAAGNGEIRISEGIEREVRTMFILSSQSGVASLGKGKAKSYLLGERRIDVDWLEPPPDELVGRKAELEQLFGLLGEVARSKQGRIATVLGEAGIGKTRLAAELSERARKAAFTVAGGRCASYGKETPYTPWSDLFRTLLAEGADRVEPDALERALDSIERPAWAPLLAPYVGVKMEDNEFTASLDPAARKQKMFALALELIIQTASENPLLLIFDNMQWVDSLSRDLIAALVDLLPDIPLMLVILARPSEDVFPWQFLPINAELRLFALNKEETHRLIAARLKAKRVDAPLLSLITDASQGNPLFVEEFVRLLETGSGLQRDGSSVALAAQADFSRLPPTIHRVVSARIDLLNERAKSILRIAAVLGPRFEFRVLNRIQDVANNEALRRQLGLLEHHGLILSAGEGDVYEFKNVLVREVAYNTLSFSKRRFYHERIANILEESGAEPEEVLLHHYSHTNDEEKTLAYLVQSAERAAAVYANEEALRYYEEALELLARRKGEADLIKRFEILLELEHIHGLVGNREMQRKTLKELLTLALSL